MDALSIAGIVVGVGAILVGQFLEGGHLSTLLNGPAILIVGGGTLGAALLQTPLPVFGRAMRIMSWILRPPALPMEAALQNLLGWSRVARKEGLLALEKLVDQQDDLFARKGLQLLVDGNEPEAIRRTLELDLISRESGDLEAAKVFEGMGGYSPTIGIIGAVMGLIHVMGNLADPSQLGGGIAVAFVATIYGVGLANLLLLPAANKLKAVVRTQSRYRELLLEGIVSIAEGENSRVIELRLQGMMA